MKRFIHLPITTLVLVSATLSGRAADQTNAAAADAAATAPAMDTSSPDALKPAMDEDAWQFGLSIPLWAPQINGNTTVRGQRENVSVSYDTLKDHLDTVFSMAVEARKGKYHFYGDVGYMKFSIIKFGTGPGVANAWSGLKFLVADAGVGYQLIKTESEHPFLLEGTVGVRYWYASDRLTLTGPGGDPFLQASKTWDVVDPVLGFRGSQYFTRKFHLDFAGDGGGFNISHETDWTWSAKAALSYDFAKWFTLSAGYQAVALDEADGSGSDKKGLNLIFNGALVSLNFHW